MTRRVLIITPYWPPVNRVGLWRPLRLCRYLPEFGWTPIVCTPRQEEVFHYQLLHDSSIQSPNVQVLQPHAVVPSMRLSQSLKFDVSSVPHMFHRAFHLLERGGNRFIKDLLLPDQFVEWGLEVALKLRWNREIEADVVWATGGPFGNLVAGALIAQTLELPLVLDYRDPWTTHRPPRPRVLSAPQWALNAVEGWTLKQASAVGYINQASYMANRAAFGQAKDTTWAVIPNGFDPIDLGAAPPISSVTPTLLYAGNFYGSRSLLPCVHALRALPHAFGAFTLKVFGQVDRAAQEELKRSPLPSDRLSIHDRVGATEIGARLKGAEALLLVIGDEHKNALSAKLFDYLASGRPIVGVGPKNAAARHLIETHKAGIWACADSIPQMIAAFTQVAHRTLSPPNLKEVAPLHAREMTRRISALLSSVF